jgi:hypothetical protein
VTASRRSRPAQPRADLGPALGRGLVVFGRLASPLGLLLLALLLAHPVQALAQSDPLKRPPRYGQPFPLLENARYLGPVLVLPGFEIRRLGYDNNIFNSRENRTADLTGEFVPSATAQLRFADRAALTGRLAFGFELFLVNREQSNINNNSLLRGDLQLGPTVLTGLWEYDKRNLRPTSDLDQRPTRRLETLSGQATWFLSPRTDVGLALNSIQYRYEDADFRSYLPLPGGGGVSLTLGQLLDRTESTPELRIRWQAFSRTHLFGELLRTDYRFEEPRLGRDAKDNRYAVGVRTESERGVRGFLRLGYVDFQPEVSLREEYRGPYGDGRVAFPLVHRTELHLGYERDLEFSTFDNILYFHFSRATVEARYRVARSLEIQGGFSYARTRYASSGTGQFEDLIEAEDGIRRDKITTPFVGLRLKMMGTWSVDMRIGFREQASNYEPANTDEFFIMNGLQRRF